MRQGLFILLVALIIALPSGALGYSVYSSQTTNTVATPAPDLHAANSNTWVLLVHGFGPTAVPAYSVWYQGQDIYGTLVHEGYKVAVVSYYGEFMMTLSTGRIYSDPTFFGTTNTPIESVAGELDKALSSVFTQAPGAQPITLDIIAHSMGGLVTLYMLEHHTLNQIKLENVIFIASPMGGAPLTALSVYDNMTGYQAQEMENGSAFLTALSANLPSAKAKYPGVEWLVYAGDADPPWGNAYFLGPNDGLVSDSSDVALGYSHEYVFPDLHIPELDPLDLGHVSYFEDHSVMLEIEMNLLGHY